MMFSLPQGTAGRPPAFVLNRGDCNGYGVLRNLAKAAVRVVSVDSDPHNVTFRSRYVSKAVCPDWERKEDDFIEFLIGLGKGQCYKPVLFCTNDSALSVVLRHANLLRNHYQIPSVGWDVSKLLVNKRRFYKTIEKLGVPHPQTQYPESLGDVVDLSKQIQYPQIVKPVQSRQFEVKFQRKCWRVDTPEQLVDAYLKTVAAGEQPLIQKEVSGQERYLVYMFFDRSGELQASCCYRKLRLNPVDYGNACLCESVEKPEVVALCEKTLRALNYRGLAEPEVQRDPVDGQLKLIEINARTTTQTRLSSRCGLNMEYLAYCDTLGLPLPESPSPEIGVKWIHLTRDFYAVFSKNGYLARRQLTIWDWIRSLCGKKEYAILAWDDIRPFVFWTYAYFKPFFCKSKSVTLPPLESKTI